MCCNFIRMNFRLVGYDSIYSKSNTHHTTWTLIWLADEMRSCFVLLLSSVTCILCGCDDFIAFSLIINNREIINRVAIYTLVLTSFNACYVSFLFFFSPSSALNNDTISDPSSYLAGWQYVCPMLIGPIWQINALASFEHHKSSKCIMRTFKSMQSLKATWNINFCEKEPINAFCMHFAAFE